MFIMILHTNGAAKLDWSTDVSPPHVVFRIRVAARRRRRLVPTRRRRHVPTVPTRTAGVPFVVPRDGLRHVRGVCIVMVRRRVTVRWMVRRRMVRRRMVRRHRRAVPQLPARSEESAREEGPRPRRTEQRR